MEDCPRPPLELSFQHLDVEYVCMDYDLQNSLQDKCISKKVFQKRQRGEGLFCPPSNILRFLDPYPPPPRLRFLDPPTLEKAEKLVTLPLHIQI